MTIRELDQALKERNQTAPEKEQAQVTPMPNNPQDIKLDYLTVKKIDKPRSSPKAAASQTFTTEYEERCAAMPRFYCAQKKENSMSSSSSSSLQEKSKEMSELRLPLYKANFWFVILWLILLINIMDRTVINGILPALKTAFHLTDAQLGMIVSATSLSLSVFVFPFAIIADKWSRRKMISIMGALWSIATYVTGLAQVFPTLLLARLSVGIGEAAYAPAATSLISAWYPQKLRSTMIGIFQSAVILGQAGGGGSWAVFSRTDTVGNPYSEYLLCRD